MAGLAGESWRFGLSPDAAFTRLQQEVQTSFAESVRSLQRTGRSVADRSELTTALAGDRRQARVLFETLDAVTPPSDAALAITVYAADGTARAWTGRPSEISPGRLSGGSSVFVTPGPLGLRLVAVEPVFERDSADEGTTTRRRIGAVAVEQVLSDATPARTARGDAFRVETSIAPITLRVPAAAAPEVASENRFLVRTPTEDVLLEVEVAPGALSEARRRTRRTVLSGTVFILAGAIVMLAGPVLDYRARLGTVRQYARASVALVGIVLVARLVAGWALPARWASEPPLVAGRSAGPIDLLLTALPLLALVVALADAVARWRRLVRRRRRSPEASPQAMRRFLAHQLGAGVAVAALFVGYTVLHGRLVDQTDIDVQHLSLYPWDADRLTFFWAVLLTHAVVVWAGVLILVGALARWRMDRHRPALLLRVVVAWGFPGVAAAGIATAVGAPLPVLPIGLATCSAVAAGLGARRATPRFRHASQAARLTMLFAALFLPAVVMYPATRYFADRAERELIESRYARQTSAHPQDLQTWLANSLARIDATENLADVLTDAAATPDRDSAFTIWRDTELAAFRLTSAVELYTPSGALVSRFALNVPEYVPTAPRQTLGCAWEVFGEASPFGAQERRMLHAQRAVCPAGTAGVSGSIVVHVMLDYRVLPFIESENPYVELFRQGPTQTENASRHEIELVVYGWGLRQPIFASGRDAWPIDDTTFDRISASREPFWTTLAKHGDVHHVYFTNDRAGIYALGYPRRGLFDTFVLIAEIATLVGLGFAALLAVHALFLRLTHRTRVGRALFSEIRASFYRKLALAFVAAAIVPVVTLAFVIRVYFTAQLRADVEAEAIRTATVAQRVIEEMALLQQRSEQPVTPLSDDVMVWISQAIDQEVNIFDSGQLLATSERDLFASGLLPTRTPSEVFRAVALQRLPSFVGEDTIGGLSYLLAATPVRAAGYDAILTVPLASRQREIERQIDELDRGVHLGAVLFILLGAGIGFSMAERIADPVARLTRVTRRIARGDFDARVAVRSVDELQRLVESFNRMAAELKEQRGRLERTNRLEAWAEMARQVAHEIKNPLTPIQLSAEHLRRVHADRGEPLAPVLDTCVESILKQVRLLRQISSEFWSFASAPSARLAQTGLGELVHEVIEPYQLGLRDRIQITVDVPATLPVVSLDRTLVARALTNIIENALHAMPGRGSLTIVATQRPEALQLAVADTGVGMDAEALARIFEPYFSTRASGTGLGLTIAKRNIELNDGTIGIESDPGRGTTVTMSFRLDNSPERDADGLA